MLESALIGNKPRAARSKKELIYQHCGAAD